MVTSERPAKNSYPSSTTCGDAHAEQSKGSARAVFSTRATQTQRASDAHVGPSFERFELSRKGAISCRRPRSTP
eukprot:4688115-Pleurochrysis_carterae.AAC.1